MKKRYRILTILLCAMVLGGCQKTPEDQIVRQKGEESIKNYQEEPAESKAEASRGEAKAEGTGQKNEISEGENALAARLEVPESYVSEDKSDDGIYTLLADATIQVPDVDKVSVYSVALREFTPELMLTFHQAFFGDAVTYEGNQYFQMTKGEIQEKIDELKAYQAQGNLDPWGIREGYKEQEDPDEDISLDEIYNIQDDIDGWEEEYAKAPVEKVKQEVTPQFDLEIPGVSQEFTNGRFVGAVETDDGVYSCTYMKDRASDKIYMSVAKVTEEGSSSGSYSWGDGGYDSYEAGTETDDNTGRPTQEEAERMAGITEEEAIAMGNAYVEKLGDEGLQLSASRLSVHSLSESEKEITFDAAGYRLHYTRTVDGFPTTYEMNPGGGLESMESTNDSASYERLSIVVNKEGLQVVEFSNWSQVVEKQVESVQLKPFPEIADIFEKMLKLENSDMGEYMSKQSYQVKEVRLGYTRIYDPGQDVTQGLLVPVWDFFGGMEGDYKYEEDSYHQVLADPYQSFLTVNAIDGTVVKRSLGY